MESFCRKSMLAIFSLFFSFSSAVAQAPLDSQDFRILIDRIFAQFSTEIALHGARPEVVFHENSSGNGAFTWRKEHGRVWEFHFYDGILKTKIINSDVLALVVCHELGHHLAGYPFKDESNWSSAEGQADFFSTHACAPRIWAGDSELNAGFAHKISSQLWKRCNDSFENQSRRDVCYRTVHAVDVLRHYEGGNQKVLPVLERPDPKRVSQTYTGHSGAQCRIDSHLAGAFCNKEFDFRDVPGHLGSGKNTLEAERDASRSNCGGNVLPLWMHRPRCWFAPLEQ